ncbi:hypothetical protein DFQ04_2749 [Algoriphagus boseongensis]|uniref:Surface antigen-like protein n=1 Tax=Algoriphagus boseongensis TaxID=1442587 RepID=A0A4R6T4I8_9BACT|nr:glyceraldehyde-3-phosphate dehydrogenase [Algoriphagus boseongensis]TDQ16627.1 hypothetical protein DFQ04_2749 [Algoriphagus boseongensis]
MKSWIITLFGLLLGTLTLAQEVKTKSRPSLKDTLDGKFDFSSFLLDANGFIPVPQLITEPALGGIGMLIAPLFIQPNKHPFPDRYTPPTLTAVAGMYTANKSWFVGGFRAGTVTKHYLRYTVFAGYGTINMNLYRDLPILGETEFAFKFKTLPIYGKLIKRIGKSDFYAGMQYLYLNTEVIPEFLASGESLPDFIEEGSLKTRQSTPGIILQLDKRDNIFTPDKGTYFQANFNVNADWTGSDYTNQAFKAYILQYFQLQKKWISGFRAETKQQFGDVPFFLESSINLRGVPAGRYQGTSTYLVETEQRYDFSLRWSGIAFAGTGKAVSPRSTFADSPWIYNYGAGVRYLVARAFKIRMGLDIAFSNDNFGYYIVFGSAWR